MELCCFVLKCESSWQHWQAVWLQSFWLIDLEDFGRHCFQNCLTRAVSNNFFWSFCQAFVNDKKKDDSGSSGVFLKQSHLKLTWISRNWCSSAIIEMFCKNILLFPSLFACVHPIPMDVICCPCFWSKHAMLISLHCSHVEKCFWVKWWTCVPLQMSAFYLSLLSLSSTKNLQC